MDPAKAIAEIVALTNSIEVAETQRVEAARSRARLTKSLVDGAGWTASDLAAMLGVSRAAVYNWLRVARSHG